MYISFNAIFHKGTLFYKKKSEKSKRGPATHSLTAQSYQWYYKINPPRRYKIETHLKKQNIFSSSYFTVPLLQRSYKRSIIWRSIALT